MDRHPAVPLYVFQSIEALSTGIYDTLQCICLVGYPAVALVDGVHLLDEAVGLGHHGPDPARHGGQHVGLGRLVARQGQLHLILLEIVNGISEISS